MRRDEKYIKFSEKLIPGAKILGVRTPDIRKIAKEILKEYCVDKITKFVQLKSDFNEEFLLKGFLINLVKIDETTRINLSRDFVKSIPNWAICDSFCEKKKRDMNLWHKFVDEFKGSKKEFEARFYYVFMFKNFIERENLDEFLQQIRLEQNDKYYVKMAMAWGLCEYFLKFNGEVFVFLQNYEDIWVKNKAISKICESFRANKELKDKLRSIKVY